MDAYPVADYYPSSSPSKFKNRSDPNVPLNNAACLGNPAGEPRRTQGPLLLTRGTTSLAVGPVPHATSSGVYCISAPLFALIIFWSWLVARLSGLLFFPNIAIHLTLHDNCKLWAVSRSRTFCGRNVILDTAQHIDYRLTDVLFSADLDTTQRRNLFSGLKSLSVFGGSKTTKTDSSKEQHSHSSKNYTPFVTPTIACFPSPQSRNNLRPQKKKIQTKLSPNKKILGHKVSDPISKSLLPHHFSTYWLEDTFLGIALSLKYRSFHL